MPIQTGNWGLDTSFPNLTTEIGHLSQSSTQTGDEVIYPPVPDTRPSPYYSWHFSKHASTPKNYYGYNNRFQQLTLGTYTAPYPNLYPNSANPTAWEFGTANIEKILQHAVMTQDRCFYTDTNFIYVAQIDFTRSFATVGSSCEGNEEFFLESPPASDFFPSREEVCMLLPELCGISDDNGGTNDNSGGNGGFTSGDLCDFSSATTGARHAFILAFGDSYETRQLTCAIIHHIYTQTDGTTRKYGHYIEVKIISNTQPPHTIVLNNPNITGIKFTITKTNNNTRVSITEIGNMGGDPYTTQHNSPYDYQVSFPTKVFFLNTILNIGNGYDLVKDYFTNYRVTDNRTSPTNARFTIQPTIPPNTTKLILESAENDPLVGTDFFNSVQFSRQATPNIFENATRSGTKWEIQNISTENPIHTLKFVSNYPIESILWTAEHTEDNPPPPESEEPKFPFFLRLQRYGYRVGPFEKGKEINDCFVTDNPLTYQIQEIGLQRFGPLIALQHPNDIRHPQADQFRYLFVNHINLQEENMEYAAGTFGPGFKLEIYQFDIKNWAYNPEGYDIGFKNLFNSYTKGFPIFVDVQPVENPNMYFPSYNWKTNTVKLYQYNDTTNSFEELEANTPVNIKIAVLAVFNIR